MNPSGIDYENSKHVGLHLRRWSLMGKLSIVASDMLEKGALKLQLNKLHSADGRW
jgi:hypothetical protein